jgi:hypothetical protein
MSNNSVNSEDPRARLERETTVAALEMVYSKARGVMRQHPGMSTDDAINEIRKNPHIWWDDDFAKQLDEAYPSLGARYKTDKEGTLKELEQIIAEMESFD